MGVLDKGTSDIVTKSGERKTLPATFLTADEANLLRNYQRWGEINHLSASMKCGSCGADAEVYIQGDIGIFCDCQCLIWRAS